MSEEPSVQEIVVRDIRMPFGSMVVFMVKWAIAAIPALIILVVIAALISVVAGGFFGSLAARRKSPVLWA